VPEAIYFGPEAAERERARRERAVRELLNPFWFSSGSSRGMTALSNETFRARVCELGLIPPPPVPTGYGDGANWVEWWEVESANWTAEQRNAVWDLLDKVQLFDVVEIELE
jgi:hypothetical protein